MAHPPSRSSLRRNKPSDHPCKVSNPQLPRLRVVARHNRSPTFPATRRTVPASGKTCRTNCSSVFRKYPPFHVFPKCPASSAGPFQSPVLPPRWAPRLALPPPPQQPQLLFQQPLFHAHRHRPAVGQDVLLRRPAAQPRAAPAPDARLRPSFRPPIAVSRRKQKMRALR